jgi:glycerol-1-phosphate dehydrogenase [NAD(P)+]
LAAGPSIDDLLSGRWREPASGRPLRLPVRRIAIEPSLDGAEADLIAPLALGSRLALVSDPNTWEALGRRVARALAPIATVDAVVVEDPRADLSTVSELAESARFADGLVAVGSGTINDLAKYLAFQSGRRYAVFATAPSMNGYVTATASLARGGFKTTLPAQAPVAALFDLAVLRTAPLRLIRAGLGDSICRTTAQTDWLLGHLLHGTAYSETPYLLQAADEAALLDAAPALGARDLAATATLTRVLVQAGLGMGIVGSSHPGSQSEHLISHYLDMMAGGAHPGSLHGEQVGVATLSVSRLQHALLGAERPPLLRPTRIDEAAMLRRFGPDLGRQCLAEFKAKTLDRAAAERLNAKLAANWAEITGRVRQAMLPTSRLRAALMAAGAPTTAADLGLAPDLYRDALRHAREIRNRFTILDLAADAGLLNPRRRGCCAVANS